MGWVALNRLGVLGREDEVLDVCVVLLPLVIGRSFLSSQRRQIASLKMRRVTFTSSSTTPVNIITD